MVFKEKDFQHSFVHAVTSEDFSFEQKELLLPIGKLSIEKVLNIYSQDYFSRLTDAMGENFEAVWAVLGDESFFSICKTYLMLYPSKNCDLGELGSSFPNFLEGHEVLVDYPFLPELARFELSFWRAFHSSYEDQVFLKNLNFESVIDSVIHFNPSLEGFSWDYKIHKIWTLRGDGFSDLNEDLERPQTLLMCRGKDNVVTLEISNSQMKLYRSLAAGLSLLEILDDLEINEVEIQEIFSFFSRNNLIQKISPKI